MWTISQSIVAHPSHLPCIVKVKEKLDVVGTVDKQVVCFNEVSWYFWYLALITFRNWREEIPEKSESKEGEKLCFTSIP